MGLGFGLKFDPQPFPPFPIARAKRKVERGDANMKETLRLELLASVQLIASIILILLWSFYCSEWWSAIFGFLAVFFLVEAIWHYALCDYIRYFRKTV